MLFISLRNDHRFIYICRYIAWNDDRLISVCMYEHFNLLLQFLLSDSELLKMKMIPSRKILGKSTQLENEVSGEPWIKCWIFVFVERMERSCIWSALFCSAFFAAVFARFLRKVLQRRTHVLDLYLQSSTRKRRGSNLLPGQGWF